MANYDLLKTITIDGVTMGLDENLGKIIGNTVNKNISTINTDTQGATITITEPGMYILDGRWRYGAGTTTGNKVMYCKIRGKLNGEASFSSLYAQTLIVQPSETGAIMACRANVYFQENKLPAQIAVFGRSNRIITESDETSIYATKLIRTVGG